MGLWEVGSEKVSRETKQVERYDDMPELKPCKYCGFEARRYSDEDCPVRQSWLKVQRWLRAAAIVALIHGSLWLGAYIVSGGNLTGR